MAHKSNIIENQVQNVLTTAKSKLEALEIDNRTLKDENQRIKSEIDRAQNLKRDLRTENKKL